VRFKEIRTAAIIGERCGGGNQIAVANSFINSQLKKRIIMMTKKRSNSLAKLRYAWSLPLLLMLFFTSFGNQVLAQTGEPVIAEESIDTIYTVDPNTYEETVKVVRDVIYENQNLDKNAVLVECAEKGTPQEQKKCSENTMMMMLYSHVSYPQEARKAKQEGMAIVKIYVDNKGSLKMIKLTKDPGYGMGIEAVRALKAAKFKWIPAELNGRKVAVEYTLPVRFKLQ